MLWWRRWWSAVDSSFAGQPMRFSSLWILSACTASTLQDGSTTSSVNCDSMAVFYFIFRILHTCRPICSFNYHFSKTFVDMIKPITFYGSYIASLFFGSTTSLSYLCYRINVSAFSFCIFLSRFNEIDMLQFLTSLFTRVQEVQLISRFYHFTVVLAFTNSCINPFIYAAKYHEFQHGVRRMIRKIKGKPQSQIFSVT